MKLKLDDKGMAVLAEVNGERLPIYIHDDGKEAPFDARTTVASLNSRIAQNQRIEQEMKELQKTVGRFKGIEDPEAALKALALAKNLDDKKLVDAGEVQRIKDETSRAFQGQLDEASKRIEDLTGKLYNEIVGGQFARSKVIAEKFAIPSDFVRAYFGDFFGVEDGKLYAVDKLGNKMLSRTRPGEMADFDEALMMMVDAHPQKAVILKAQGGSGGGAPPSGGGGNQGTGGKPTMTRSQFQGIRDPIEQANAAKKFEIVDA